MSDLFDTPDENDDDLVSDDWVVEFIILLEQRLASNHEDAAVIARGWVAEGYGDAWVVAPRGGPAIQIDAPAESEETPEE